MFKMIATKPHKFQGRNRVVGDRYDATASDADVLRKTGWATDYVEKKPKEKTESKQKPE